jgi:hypothetical protein
VDKNPSGVKIRRCLWARNPYFASTKASIVVRKRVDEFQTAPHEGTLEYQSVSISEPYRRTAKPSAPWIIWLASIGIFLPYTIGTTGKYVIGLLFLPAVVHFLNGVSQGRRRTTLADFSIWAMGLWMIAAEIIRTGSLSMAVGSDVLAFVGSYMVARSFIFGELSLKEFTKAFKITAVVLIALSVLDTLSGRFFINSLVGEIFPEANRQIQQVSDLPVRGDVHRELFGVTVIRAASTFAHPILYGTFCAIASTIFLYLEQRPIRRLLYVAICLGGCILSISSGPLLSIIIAISICCYDYALKRSSVRWKILWAGLATSFAALFLLSNRPFGFLISHFTLDPATGYFRMLIWDNALDYIAMAPLLGNSASAWATNDILSDTVDCVWLVLALLYGLPTVGFLLLASLAACIRFGRGFDIGLLDVHMRRMRTAFSLVLAMFAFIGLTVHFWDAIWMFWALCIGIRVSIEEFGLAVVQGPLSRVSARRLTLGEQVLRRDPVLGGR